MRLLKLRYVTLLTDSIMIITLRLTVTNTKQNVNNNNIDVRNVD